MLNLQTLIVCQILLIIKEELRWLSIGKVLSWLSELSDKIRIYFIYLKSPFSPAERLNEYSWLAMLEYMTDIFTRLNALNLSMQGEGITILMSTTRSRQ